MRKTTTGLGINSQIGVAALHSEGKRPIGMSLGQSDISFSPSEIHIRHTWHDVMDRINLTTFQLKDPIEERAGFFFSIEHHQRSTAQNSQPDLDIKTQRLTVEFYDLVSPVRCLNIHLKRV